MTIPHYLKRFDELLSDLAAELDVPPSKYREAKDRYDAVGAWLGEDGSELAEYNPAIYPQGSFALGTAIRPVGEGDYDVDAVCLLEIEASETTQQQLKAMVGDRLKHPSSRYKRMIDPEEGGRRCWTIKYADESKFHLDILPSVPDDYAWLIALGVPEEWAKSAICITDRETWKTDLNWPRSNPKGYAAWFKERMQERLYEQKLALARAERAEVEEIEDFEVRTPLQRMIQLLKRHRDVRYDGDDDKPISIIITTLAARSYDNELTLGEAMLNVGPRMRQNIELRDNTFWVANPVNPHENFADKWAETPRKAEIFFHWLEAIEREHEDLLTESGFRQVGSYLTTTYGARESKAALARYASRGSATATTAGAPAVILTGRKTDEPQRPRIELPPNPSKPWGP